MNTVVIYSIGRSFQVKINDNSELSQKYLSEDIVKLYFSSVGPVGLSIGDYVVVFGRKYFLNTKPIIKKISSKLYEYECVFEAYIYDLTKVVFLDVDETNIHFSSEFSVTGNLETFCSLIKLNLKRVYGEFFWDVQNTYNALTGKNVTKTLTFSEDNCLTALKKIVEEYNIDYDVSEDDPDVYQIYLYLRDVEGYVPNVPFVYGKGNGLYSLIRRASSSNNITTRLFVYGGSENLGPNYRNYSPRLKIPQTSSPQFTLSILEVIDNIWPQRIIKGYTTALYVQVQILVGGVYTDTGTPLNASLYPTIGLQYDRPPVEFRVKAWINTGQYLYSDGTYDGFDNIRDSYVENLTAIQKYGLIERIVIFDEIFPTRTGTVTSISSNVLEFIDTSMFDLNEVLNDETVYLISGLNASIKFNTGNLAGYEFTISKYDTVTKTFLLNKLVDERGLVIPNEETSAFKISVGDEYVILNINLPSSYIVDAETRLLNEANNWLAKYCNEQVSYDLDIDEKFVSDNSIVIGIGSLITIEDSAMNISEVRRVTEVKRLLVRPDKYDIVLSDSVYSKKIRSPVRLISKESSLKDSGAISFNEVTHEQLIGVINGINTVFSTPSRYKSMSISCFRNGLKEKYFNELSDTQIEFHTAPSNVGFTDILETIYTKKTI